MNNPDFTGIVNEVWIDIDKRHTPEHIISITLVYDEGDAHVRKYIVIKPVTHDGADYYLDVKQTLEDVKNE